MNDAVRVGLVDPGAGLDDVAHRIVGRERAVVLEHLREVATVQVLHGDER